MSASRVFSEIKLVNYSIGDPVLYVDYPGKNDGFLFDAGNLAPLPMERLADLQAVFLTHFHLDHFTDFDRILRANLDRDKTLLIFGPLGSIDRIYRRIKTYELQFFPFMKLVIEVHELSPGMRRVARLDCAERFPEPRVDSVGWKGTRILETSEIQFEAVPVDHTTPCLAYALAERRGWHPDPEKLTKGLLRPGPWVAKALELLQQDAEEETILEVDGGRFTLGQLAEQYFAKSRGARIAFVTDTAWSEQSKPGLIKLAARAQQLYCDCYYAQAQWKQAQQHRHMTARNAGELAAAAKVEQLVLMHFGSRYSGRYDELLSDARAVFANTVADLPSDARRQS